MAKKYVSLTRLSDFLDNLKNTFSTITHNHTLSDITDYKVDTNLSSTSTNPVQNKVINEEFEAISQAMIAYDLALDGKANTSHNHTISDVEGLEVALDNKIPISRTINGKELSSDITLYASDVGASASSHNHDDIYYTETEIDAKLLGKANTSHNHDDIYYTETEIDAKLLGKSDTSHNHDSVYDNKGAAADVQKNLDAANGTINSHIENEDIHVTTANKSNWNTAYTHSQSAHARTDATKVEDSTTNGNIKIDGEETNVYSHPNSGVTAGTYKSVTVNAQGHITAGSNPTTLSGYGITDAETKSDANEKLIEAKNYADAIKNDLLNNAGSAYDTLKELGDLIDDNKDAIDALEIVATGKANKVHTHVISDVINLQTTLNTIEENIAQKTQVQIITWGADD